MQKNTQRGANQPSQQDRKEDTAFLRTDALALASTALRLPLYSIFLFDFPSTVKSEVMTTEYFVLIITLVTTLQLLASYLLLPVEIRQLGMASLVLLIVVEAVIIAFAAYQASSLHVPAPPLTP